LGGSGQCCRRLRGIAGGLRRARGASRWARPLALTHATGTGAAVVRRRAPLRAENAVLRQQLLVLRRRIKRPVVTAADRALPVVLAGRVRARRQALLLVRPETLLRWHRAGFRSCWRWQSRPGPGRPPLPTETVALIRQMAAENPLWGAERSRGELGKVGIRTAKRTSQTYRRGHRAPRPRGQTWATFLRNHAPDSWACDVLPVTDLLFRPLCACFVVELATRRGVHLGATRQPTDAGIAQPLRAAPPLRPAPALPDPRQRWQVRAGVRPRRGGQWHHAPAHATPGAAGQRRLRALPGERASRAPRPRARPRRAAAVPRAPRVRGVLQPRAAAPGPQAGAPGAAPREDGALCRTAARGPGPGWPAPHVSARRVRPADAFSGQHRGTIALMCRHRALVARSTAEVSACRRSHPKCEQSNDHLFSQTLRHWGQRRRAKVALRPTG